MTHMASDILLAVLVVEDDGSVVEMPGFSLRSAAFDTTEMTTGGETLSMAEEQPPHAVILDWLRQVGERTKRPPVWVVISAPGEEKARPEGPWGGRVLARPFGSLDLIAMLEKLLLAKDGPY
ncbi:MAG: hypothetical protein AMJ76_01760 [Dehalococcoidia bacterium SM23_28_1]|nr:MAG: hypothetical protein AMJ76_01760 [Dehalococcoidia bacterium SM23_28_1]